MKKLYDVHKMFKQRIATKQIYICIHLPRKTVILLSSQQTYFYIFLQQFESDANARVWLVSNSGFRFRDFPVKPRRLNSKIGRDDLIPYLWRRKITQERFQKIKKAKRKYINLGQNVVEMRTSSSERAGRDAKQRTSNAKS